MTNIIDRAAEVLRRVDGDHTLGAGALAEALADEGLLRPPASKLWINAVTHMPSFSFHEDSPVDGPNIEAEVERRYLKDPLDTFVEVSIDLVGKHGATYIYIKPNSEWCRAAAAVLLDVADALDTIQEADALETIQEKENKHE